jgi:hypothetical protein
LTFQQDWPQLPLEASREAQKLQEEIAKVQVAFVYFES